MPIERAVPRMVLAAASTVDAFMSGIFCVAMAMICFSVTLPTFSLFGVPEPLGTPAAFSRSTGAGGVWVFAPDGTHLGIIRLPEIPANLAFGGPDLRTLFLTARTSVYSLQVKTPGLPHPHYARHGG